MLDRHHDFTLFNSVELFEFLELVFVLILVFDVQSLQNCVFGIFEA